MPSSTQTTPNACPATKAQQMARGRRLQAERCPWRNRLHEQCRQHSSAHKDQELIEPA